MIFCRIHERSWLALVAARKLRSRQMAVTLGRSIHLWNTSRGDFLHDTAWLRHELCHVRQFRQYGFFRFLWLYLLENLRHGYEENRFEKEARAAEKGDEPLTGYSFERC